MDLFLLDLILDAIVLHVYMLVRVAGIDRFTGI